MYKYKINFATFILLALILCSFNMQVYGATSNKEDKIVMIIINRVDFHDLYNMPTIKGIIRNGSIGLMNTRAAGSHNQYKSYATLGAGIRAEASGNRAIFHALDKDIRAIYERRKGDFEEFQGLINLEINSLLQQNIRGEYGAIPGVLGNALRSNGYKTVVIGNSNTDKTHLAEAGFIAMDSRGYIDYGRVDDDILIDDEYRPFGIKTNYTLLYESFLEFYPKGNFIVVETGDMNRLEAYKENLNGNMFQQHKEVVLKDIDNFIYNLLNTIDFNNTKLMIVTPFPSDAAVSQGERLTPVIFYDGGVNEGVLWSASTRRTGIIGNVDIAPTILSYFDIVPEGMTGKNIETVERINNIDFINELNKKVVNTSVQRYRVLYSFAVFQMMISTMALLTIVLRRKISSKWYKPISLVLLGTILVPLTLLLLPLFGVLSITQNYMLLTVITAVLVLGLYFIGRKEPLNIIIYTCFLMSFGLKLDILLGQNLIKNSILGYDPIIGARYYGIGNEFMGILIGSVLIFTSGLRDKYNINRYVVLLIYVFTIIVIALPNLGANVGGTITAVFVFMFTFIRFSNKRISLKSLTYIIFSVIMVIMLIAGIDLLLMKHKSHLATAIQQIIANGPIVIYQIIVRKITMNLRVMGVTIWSRVLLSAIIILGVLFYRPVGIIKKITANYPNMAIGWGSIIVACIVSFAVNDSGVVSAATTIMFLTTTILYLIMDIFYGSNRIH